MTQNLYFESGQEMYPACWDDTIIDIYKNVKCSTPTKAIQLSEWIAFTRSEQARKMAEHAPNKQTQPDEYKAYKAQLPAVTISGVTKGKRLAKDIEHNNLLTLDFDNQDADSVKGLCSQIRECVYAGVSLSGFGAWAIFRIAYPEKHQQHFLYLSDFFERNGFEVDQAGKDISRLRIASYDPEPFYNLHADYLRAFHVPKPQTAHKQRQHTPGKISKEWILQKLQSSIDGEHFHTRQKWAYVAGGYAAKGLMDVSADDLVQDYVSRFSAADSPSVQHTQIKTIKDCFDAGFKNPGSIQKLG